MSSVNSFSSKKNLLKALSNRFPRLIIVEMFFFLGRNNSSIELDRNVFPWSNLVEMFLLRRHWSKHICFSRIWSKHRCFWSRSSKHMRFWLKHKVETSARVGE